MKQGTGQQVAELQTPQQRRGRQICRGTLQHTPPSVVCHRTSQHRHVMGPCNTNTSTEGEGRGCQVCHGTLQYNVLWDPPPNQWYVARRHRTLQHKQLNRGGKEECQLCHRTLQHNGPPLWEVCHSVEWHELGRTAKSLTSLLQKMGAEGWSDHQCSEALDGHRGQLCKMIDYRVNHWLT